MDAVALTAGATVDVAGFSVTAVGARHATIYNGQPDCAGWSGASFWVLFSVRVVGVGLVGIWHIGVVDCFVVIDSNVGVTPADLARVWAADAEASGVGSARVVPARPGVFLPGLTEWLLIPLAINLASAGLVALVTRLVKRARADVVVEELEVVEVTSSSGDRVVVVRLRRSRS